MHIVPKSFAALEWLSPILTLTHRRRRNLHERVERLLLRRFCKSVRGMCRLWLALLQIGDEILQVCYGAVELHDHDVNVPVVGELILEHA